MLEKSVSLINAPIYPSRKCLTGHTALAAEGNV